MKKPKNYRDTTPRCCMTCKHFVVTGDEQKSIGHIPNPYMVCERDGETGNADEQDYFKICDYYKRDF